MKYQTPGMHSAGAASALIQLKDPPGWGHGQRLHAFYGKHITGIRVTVYWIATEELLGCSVPLSEQHHTNKRRNRERSSP